MRRMEQGFNGPISGCLTRFRAGTRIAPFLGANGRPVVLTIGKGGCLISSVEIAPGEKWPRIARLVPRGLYRAPWMEGAAYMAIDADHRCVAQVEMTLTNGGLRAAVRDLTLIRSIVENSGIDDASESPRDCDGDEWKNGTRYDEGDGEDWKR